MTLPFLLPIKSGGMCGMAWNLLTPEDQKHLVLWAEDTAKDHGYKLDVYPEGAPLYGLSVKFFHEEEV